MSTIVYRAKFFDVDVPKYCSEEETFSYFAKAEDFVLKHAKAEAFVLKHAKVKGITKPAWKTSGAETYFNHQFRQDPIQGSVCFHGNIEEVEIK